jgi:hypothetical protein
MIRQVQWGSFEQFRSLTIFSIVGVRPEHNYTIWSVGRWAEKGGGAALPEASLNRLTNVCINVLQQF